MIARARQGSFVRVLIWMPLSPRWTCRIRRPATHPRRVRPAMPSLPLCVVDSVTVLPAIQYPIRVLALGLNNGICGSPMATPGKRRIARNAVFYFQRKCKLKVGLFLRLCRNQLPSCGFLAAWRDTPISFVAFKALRDFPRARQRNLLQAYFPHSRLEIYGGFFFLHWRCPFLSTAFLILRTLYRMRQRNRLPPYLFFLRTASAPLSCFDLFSRGFKKGASVKNVSLVVRSILDSARNASERERIAPGNTRYAS